MNGQMKGFVNGVLFSLVGKPLPITQKEPVAYLYNGMRLPDINSVWDKETYPYAFICHTSNPNSYTLHLNPQSAVIEGDHVHTRGYGVFYANWGGNNKWSYLGTQWTEGEWTKISSITDGCQWSNHDIINEDGSVYLSASKPIPVYE